MADNRDLQALDYDPTYDKHRYVKEYKELKQKGKREGHPDVQPHHIRGLNNYHYAWRYLSPENRIKLQDELKPYGLNFGNDKNNLVAAEGQWSKSKPGETRYGGQHGQLHQQQETAMQDAGFDRSKAKYTGVAGVPWSEMSQEDIMGFLRSMAVKDEMTVNKTLSTALPMPQLLQQRQQQVQTKFFGNRLVDTLSNIFEAQGSSLEEAADVSRSTTQRREAGAEVARQEGGLMGMPDFGVTETLAGFSMIDGRRQDVMRQRQTL